MAEVREAGEFDKAFAAFTTNLDDNGPVDSRADRNVRPEVSRDRPDREAQRRSLLTAALGFRRLHESADRLLPEIRPLASWMDSWSGLGAVVTGMRAQGSDLELKEFPTGWRATFYPAGIAHSVVEGSAFEPAPWRAVQEAAWTALHNPERQPGW